MRGHGKRVVVAAWMAALGIAASVGPGCIVDPDRFTQPSVGDSSSGGNVRSLKLHLIQMLPHEGHLFEYRIIDNDRNLILFRGVQDAISDKDTDFFAPQSIPSAATNVRLDYYADVNFSGTLGGVIDVTKAYDGTANSPTKDGGTTKDSDHAWRIDPLQSSEGVTATQGLIEVNFPHNTLFTDINTYPSGTVKPPTDTGFPAQFRLENNKYLGSFTSINVFNQASNLLVCQYRFRTSSTPTLLGSVPGCVDQVTTYRVEVYIDTNNNSTYDDPSKEGGDWGYSQVLDSDRDRLDFTVDLSQPTGKATVSPPK
jgi:hypothetical protein